MKSGTSTHPKLLALAAALGITRRDAVGLVELLWEHVARYAPAGDIGRFSDAQIALAVDWPVDDAKKLVSALLRCGGRGRKGFIERSRAHRLIVHDWPAHAPEFVRKRVQRERVTWARPDDWQAPDCPDLSGQRPLTECSEAEPREGKTEPSEAKPSPTTPGQGGPRPDSDSVSRSLSSLARGSVSVSRSGEPALGPVGTVARKLAAFLAPGALDGDGRQQRADATCLRQWASKLALGPAEARDTALAKAAELAADASVNNRIAAFSAWFKGRYGGKP